jgi:UTP-glucose-1-phosphate uridylyltransferase
LRNEGLEDGRYLAHCGIYIFDAEIFDCLEREQSKVKTRGGELELAAAQVRFLQRYPDSHYLLRIDGKAYDMGNPEGYLKAFTALAGDEQHG